MTAGEQFRALVGRNTAADVARRLGVDESTARAWANGRRTPSWQARAKIEATYGVPASGWHRGWAYAAAVAPDTPAVTETPDKPRPRRRGRASKDMSAEALLELVVERFRALDTEASDPAAHTPVRDRAATLAGLTNAIRTLAKLRGEDEVSRAKWLASPEWQRIVETLAETLKPWPDALRAVGEAMQRLDEEEGRRR